MKIAEMHYGKGFQGFSFHNATTLLFQSLIKCHLIFSRPNMQDSREVEFMSKEHQPAKQIFSGNSDMAMLMRSCDCSKTSLGLPGTWSQSLKTAEQAMLTSRQPILTWCSDELINLYNDAYRLSRS